jgi:hypothetical protein
MAATLLRTTIIARFSPIRPGQPADAETRAVQRA